MGTTVVTKEEFEGTGMPDDDKLVDEWIENGGTFRKGKAKRYEPSGGKKSGKAAGSKKLAGDSGKKRSRGAAKAPSTKTKKNKSRKQLEDTNFAEGNGEGVGKENGVNASKRFL